MYTKVDLILFLTVWVLLSFVKIVAVETTSIKHISTKMLPFLTIHSRKKRFILYPPGSGITVSSEHIFFFDDLEI